MKKQEIEGVVVIVIAVAVAVAVLVIHVHVRRSCEKASLNRIDFGECFMRCRQLKGGKSFDYFRAQAQMENCYDWLLRLKFSRQQAR